jgi:uncharacterized protein (UPF0332 family)
MSFNYEDYLYIAQNSLGRKSAKQASAESICRSAISRAYYAVFLTARDYLVQHTPLIIPRDGTVHLFVREHFLALGRTDGKFRRIGFELRYLHEHRNKADYGETLNGLDKLTEDALQRAQDALDKLGELK